MQRQAALDDAVLELQEPTPEPERDLGARQQPAQQDERDRGDQLQLARLRRNPRRTLWLSFFDAFLLVMPVAVPFFQSKGLSMQEVFSLEALFALLVMVLEVPSGYLADLIGRRRCLVLGALFCGVGHSLLLIADGFWTLALFEAALALAYSLTSGADLALLYDTELALGSSARRQHRVVGKLYAVSTLAEATAGVACSLLLLWWSMEGVVWAQVLVGWLPLVFALRLTEPPVTRMVTDSHAANMVRIVRHLLNDSQVLRLTFLALCIWSLTTFYIVWLLPKLWQQQGVGLAHYGYLWAGLCMLGAVAGRMAHWTEQRIGPTGVLLIVGLVPMFGYLGMAWFGVVVGVIAAAILFVARGLGMVILTEALNSRVPSEFRATANSLASFGFRGAFAVTGPLVGLAFDLWDLKATMVMLAVVSGLIGVSLVLPLIFAARAAMQRG